jgi:lipoate-protein ligase A
MALDNWLLNQQIQGHMGPWLRFYTWAPAAISLGYHQRQWPEPWAHLAYGEHPLTVVRRPSGGRAVLHQGDLTYAIALPLQGKRRQDWYRAIGDGLIAGWKTLGVSLTYGEAGRGYIHRPDCFGTATAADLVTPEGFKLIGSAQLRREHYLLQHGSMRLGTDPQLYQRVFGVPLGHWRCPPDLQGVDSREPGTAMGPVTTHIIRHLTEAIAQQLQRVYIPLALEPADWVTMQRQAVATASIPLL